MYHGIFQFIFFFIVKDQAIFIKETHYRGFPTRTAKEIYYYVEKPILYINIDIKEVSLHFPLLKPEVWHQ